MKFIEKQIANLVLLVVIAVSVFPFIYMLIMSLKNTLSTYDFNLNGLTLENYVKIFRTAEFERYLFCFNYDTDYSIGSHYRTAVFNDQKSGLAEYLPGIDSTASYSSWNLYYEAGYFRGSG